MNLRMQDNRIIARAGINSCKGDEMPTGAFILVELEQEIEEEALDEKRGDLLQYARENLGNTLEDSIFYSNKPLKRIEPGNWVTTVPAIPFYQTSNGKDWLDLNINYPVYEPGYERGDLQIILAVAAKLDDLFPTSTLWYGNDSSGDPNPFGATERALLSSYWEVHHATDPKANGPNATEQQDLVKSYYRTIRQWRMQAHKRSKAVRPDPDLKFQVEIQKELNWLSFILRKRRILKLIKLLNLAEQQLRKGKWDATWAAVDSAEELADELEAYQEQFRVGDLSMLGEADAIFSFTGPWDDLLCIAGCDKPAELATKIQEVASKFKKRHTNSGF